jgi:hypothetical protein
MNISFTSIQHHLTQMHWTLWTTTYIEYLCLGKMKVGKLETKFCFHQRYLYSTSYICSQLTLKSYKEHSFSIILMYYKSCIASNNTRVSIYYYFLWCDKTQESLEHLKYTLAHKIKIAFNNIWEPIKQLQNYDKPHDLKTYWRFQVQ